MECKYLVFLGNKFFDWIFNWFVICCIKMVLFIGVIILIKIIKILNVCKLDFLNVW